jgi:3-isopropylmalate/(R)-2-methylmalate dehydratase small subunit
MIEGRAYILGDNIDTDQIYPGCYLDLTDIKIIASHCLEGVNPEFAEKYASGAILVAGRNFGCGSSREHAVITLKEAGVLVVIANSFARIFYRNAINLGLPVLTFKDSKKLAAENDTLSIDLNKGTIHNKNNNTVYQGEQLPDFILNILQSGGIKSSFKKLYSKG